MRRISRRNIRESGTGQDTPLGVCPCPAPLPATPFWTWLDIVPCCPVVTHRSFLESQSDANSFFRAHGACRVLNQQREAV
jgi:hypothetical protein